MLLTPHACQPQARRPALGGDTIAVVEAVAMTLVLNSTVRVHMPGCKSPISLARTHTHRLLQQTGEGSRVHADLCTHRGVELFELCVGGHMQQLATQHGHQRGVSSSCTQGLLSVVQRRPTLRC